MTDRDSITWSRARTPGAEDYPTSTVVHRRVTSPDSERVCRAYDVMHEGRKPTNVSTAYAASWLELCDAGGRLGLKYQPSSRTGENPPYGMIGEVVETSASFEARFRATTLPDWISAGT